LQGRLTDTDDPMKGALSLFCRDQPDRIVINRGERMLDALPRHEDLARALGM
jgi:hypothetical protein